MVNAHFKLKFLIYVYQLTFLSFFIFQMSSKSRELHYFGVCKFIFQFSKIPSLSVSFSVLKKPFLLFNYKVQDCVTSKFKKDREFLSRFSARISEKENIYLPPSTGLKVSSKLVLLLCVLGGFVLLILLLYKVYRKAFFDNETVKLEIKRRGKLRVKKMCKDHKSSIYNSQIIVT